MRCANGKYRYGDQGACVYDTLKDCEAAAAAIHIANRPEKSTKDMKDSYGTTKPFPGGTS